jgi:hypothetical protein
MCRGFLSVQSPAAYVLPQVPSFFDPANVSIFTVNRNKLSDVIKILILSIEDEINSGKGYRLRKTILLTSLHL